MEMKCENCVHIEVHGETEPCRSCVPLHRHFESAQPAREPQCRDQADLYEQYARVLRMCEAAEFEKPWDCVQNGGVFSHTGWNFEACEPEEMEFALAIIEGKPVWCGGFAYTGDNRRVEMHGILPDGRLGVRFDSGAFGSFLADELMVAPATISINGVEVKAPHFVGHSFEFVWEKFTVNIEYKNQADAEAFKAALEGR